jgi:hypothetical protein
LDAAKRLTHFEALQKKVAAAAGAPKRKPSSETIRRHWRSAIIVMPIEQNV